MIPYNLAERQIMTAKKSILVVDDEETIREVVCRYLEREGFNVREAADGYEALTIVQHEDRIDLIILDVMMPLKDGFTTCRELKADPKTKDVPVIMCTAKASSEDVIRSKEVGASDYIVKPCRKDTVIQKVKKILGET